ncbi:antibiotic biosynthesis monooxygenase [Nocardioides sp. QY071]|uniref:antibiotic biosynthesis monooxygenase n=1 Tax=Nocardioides sp. QY071 TaxID=3044187 RepID=UPI00249A8751|nr:antibiotic biosynthesis monooxygenase [Nocardioides sp. QY071]WGY04220.1 antibiotic biosynthesis monooxygenase [Nocardioides sp. QY071]
MYARSSTFHGNPAKIDAGIKFVEAEAAPTLSKMEGCLGLSLLVDRATGYCIATSSWETEEAMTASDAMLRPMRDRGRDVLGASMQVDSWEIVVMHRTHHAACCRASWLEGDLDAMTETFRVALLPRLEEMDGFCSASLLVDRATGLGCATTAWESHDAMVASRAMADEMRECAATESSGVVVEVHEFDLAYAHLHVPEMA